MIFKYGGVDIETIAPVKIEDIRISPIKYYPVSRSRPIRWGSDFVRMRGGERTIAVTFAIINDDKSSRQADILALSQWAKTDKEYEIEIPYDADRVLFGVCTSKPEPSIRQWWENKLRFVFTCYDNPFWTGKNEIIADCDESIVINGNAPPLMQIVNTFDAAAENVEYSDGENIMQFSEIPAGDLVIDLNRQTAEVDGESVMQNYIPASRFIIPATGSFMITGDGTIKYRERWE